MIRIELLALREPRAQSKNGEARASPLSDARSLELVQAARPRLTRA